MGEKRDRHWSKESPAGPWDTLVIGSGMGGMTTAALLSKLGQRVLVLEQHYVPGGFTHMFRRPGYLWDVGVHAVGEVDERSMTGRLLRALSGGELRWASLGDVYDEFHFPGPFHINFPNHPEKFRENLRTAFPAEEPAIDAYFEKVRTVVAGMKRYYLSRVAPLGLAWLLDRTVARQAHRELELKTGDVVRGLTRDPRLRALLTAQWGYYGSPPSRSSFAIQALVTHHFKWGGYYPIGGAQEIARGLLGTVAKAGGWTRIGCDVAEILVEKGRAVGVRLADGEEIRARRVVSAAGVASTVGRLLPEPFRGEPWAREVLALAPAPAHVCLYVGFKGDIRKAGAGPANKWFYQTWDMEAEAWAIDGPDPLPPAPVLYCSFPSLKDPAHDPGPDEHHTGEVVTFVPWSSFERWQGERWKRRGEEYDALKQRIHDALLEQFLAQMPGLAPHLAYAELSTPVSTHKFTRPVQGSIYGIEPTPQRFRNAWLRPRSPIPGLFFSGSEVATVGVMGAMMGGLLAGVAVDPIGALGYIRRQGMKQP